MIAVSGHGADGYGAVGPSVGERRDRAAGAGRAAQGQVDAGAIIPTPDILQKGGDECDDSDDDDDDEEEEVEEEEKDEDDDGVLRSHGLQMFHQPVRSAKQGDRLGLCVTNLDAKAIERGIATTPGSELTAGRHKWWPYSLGCTTRLDERFCICRTFIISSSSIITILITRTTKYH
jgi:hypothetical protein